METIRQMFRQMGTDIRSFFASPKDFWAAAPTALRIYLISDTIGNLSLIGLAAALVVAQLDMSSLILPLLGPSLLGAIIAFLGALVEWLRGGRRYAIISVILFGAILSVPITLLATNFGAPMIHDISTDTKNPPRFDKIKSVRPLGANPLTRKQKGLASMQRKAYPKVKTLRLYKKGVHPAKVFEAARDLAQAEGWDIVSVSPEKRIIEATAATFFMRFKDDIIIRIGQKGGKRPVVIVDMRSVSRIGRSDLGKNAQRITNFLTALKQKVYKK